jgi:hypothetical protein
MPQGSWRTLGKCVYCQRYHKHWELHEKEDFIERLCMANDDTSDIKNRIDKVTYQEEQLKLNQEVAGVQSLCKLMGISPKAGLDCIDAIKPESEKALLNNRNSSLYFTLIN